MSAVRSTYLGFLIRNRRLLGFGLLMAFASSFGQSFFVGLFQLPMRDAFGLSASEFGGIYSFVTLLSAAVLPWTGKLIDRFSLKLFTFIAILAFAAGAAGLALAPNIVLLVAAFFLLRHFGQGLVSHAGSTAMGRYFEANRGKAVTFYASGYAIGEAVLPAVAVATIAAWGWQNAWLGVTAFLVMGVIPAAMVLLNRAPRMEEADPAAAGASTSGAGARTASRDWTRPEVLRDPRFYILMPALMAPAFILTGFFVHQGFLAESKGWALEWVAIGFSAFAVVKLASGLLAGPFADRFGSHPLIGLYMVPLALSMLVLVTMTSYAGLFLYFVLAGISTGAATAVGGLLWPELYGTRHLGAIRSLSMSLMVFSTALAPVFYGWFIDAGLTASDIALIALGYNLMAVALLGFFVRSQKAHS